MKVLHIDSKFLEIKRNNKKELLKRSHLVHEEESFENNRYYVFSIRIQSKFKSVGIESNVDKTIVSSLDKRTEEENETLRRLRFLVVDTNKKTVYFDGHRSDVELIMKEFFDVNKNILTSKVELKDLKYLTTISIVKVNSDQIGGFDDEMVDEIKALEILFDGTYEKDVQETHITVELKDHTKPSKYFIDKFVRQKELDTKETLVFEGLDEYGNELIYNSFLSKKIEILPEYDSFDKKINLKLKTVLEAIKEKEGAE